MKQRRKLETDGTGIRFIRQQKLKHKIRSQDGWIPRSIRNRAVRDLKKDLKARFTFAGCGSQAGAQQFRGLKRALHAASNLKKSPSGTPGRVLHQQSKESGERYDDVIEQIQSAEISLVRV